MKKPSISKVKPKKVIEWALICVALLLCSLAEIKGGLRPFGIGLFAGLVFCRKNLLILAPILLVCSLIGDFCWQSAVSSALITVVYFAAYCIHRLIKKRLRAVHLLCYTALSVLPTIFMYGISADIICIKLAEGLISVVFTLLCINLCYLFFVKGFRYKLTPMEELSVGVLLSVFSLAFYRFNFGGVSPFLFIFGFFVCAAPYFYGERGCLGVFFCGLGGTLAFGSPTAAAFAAFCAVASLILKKYRFVSALAVAVADLALGLCGFFPTYSFVNCILIAVGGLTFAFIPKKQTSAFFAFLGADRGIAVRTLVNRNRLDIYNRIKGMSDVLGDMHRMLDEGQQEMASAKENKGYLSEQLALAVCADCPKKPECEHSLGTATSFATYSLISNALNKGHVTILDLPPFLGENCERTAKMLVACRELVENYSVKKELSDNVNACKTLMCEQVAGLSGMLESFAKELKQTVTFDTDKEKRLIDELSAVNIIASEAAIFRSDDLINALVVVREGDENKPALERTVSSILGKVVKNGSVRSAGSVSITFVTAPRYDAIYGVSGSLKEGSTKSGDSHSAIRISSDKLMFAVCDGMGSGSNAAKCSENALSLVESFYKAGIDEGAVLSLINKLLAVRDSDDFSALDMCVINLRRGTADFIKLGGVESVIRHKEGLETIEGGALPMGILESVRPCVCRRKVVSGDMIVLYSDGIADSIGTDGVVRLLEQNPTANPEVLSALIVEDATYVTRKDDCTVLCIRLFERL